jgi:ligand-binding sensor domain-containing protein
MSGMRSWIATFLLTIGVVAPAVAQNIQDAMKPFVSATDLRAVERDSRGNLWIATGGGAARFGLANHDWEVFPRLLGTGPRGNDLVTLCIDSQERIWVGSASRGFTFYDPDTRVWDRESEEWPDPRIRVIRCLAGGVYIGTQGGLSLKPTQNRTDICAASDPGCIVPSYVVNDYALQGDSLWVATENGLGRFNGTTWDSTSKLPPGSVGHQSFSLAIYHGTVWEVVSSDRVRHLENGVWVQNSVPSVRRVVVREGHLYALGGNKIYRWDGSGWTDLNAPLGQYDDVRDMEVIGQDMYLALNVGLGLWRGGTSLDARFMPPGPRFGGSYSALAVDSRGTVWAGTSEQSVGLVKYDGTTWNGVAAFEANLGSGWLLSMLADSRDLIWLGHCCCFGNPSACELQRVNVDSTIGPITGVGNIRDFDEDAQGRIWMGSDGLGVLVRDPDGDPNGCQPGNSNCFDLTVQSTGGKMSSDVVRAVAATQNYAYLGHDSNGLDIWPHGGNLNFGRDGSNWVHIGDTGTNSLLDQVVRDMTFREGDLWIATASGLHRIDGVSILDRCPARDRELPGDPIRIVNALAADKQGGLWVGTDSGILYLPKGGACDGGGGDFQSFTADNSPLPDNRVLTAAQNPRDGSMWFGTAQGLLRVDPLTLNGKQPQPDTYVLYPNPVYPSSPEGNRRSAIFGINRGGVRVEVVPTTDATQPRVYDLAGHHVGDFEMASGSGKTYWVWRVNNVNGDVVAPGIYLVQAEVGGVPVTLKMGVVR